MYNDIFIKNIKVGGAGPGGLTAGVRGSARGLANLAAAAGRAAGHGPRHRLRKWLCQPSRYPDGSTQLNWVASLVLHNSQKVF